MDEKLKELLDQARAKGASKEQLQGIVDNYRAKQGSEPKGVTAEGSGESDSASAGTTSLSDSEDKRTLVEKIDAGEIDTTYDPDPQGILRDMPDGGLALKDEAARKLQSFYEAAGLKEYNLDNNAITQEALRIKRNRDRDIEEQRKWDDYDFWAESWLKVKASTNRAIAGIAGLPNYMTKTMFTLTADDEMLEFANSLDPKAREIFINAVIYNPTFPTVGGELGMLSAEAQENLNEKASAIEADMTQFDNFITDDLSDGNYGKAAGRIMSEGIGSVPSIVQAMIPYVGIGSIMAGSAANKQEELESEGYELGGDTTLNSIISGSAEGLFEIYTKRLGGKLFRSLKGSTPAGRQQMFDTVKEHLIKAPLYEGGTEGATALVQNLSDLYVQGKEKEFNEVWKEISDSFLIGMGVGKAMGGTTYVSETSRTLYQDIKTNQILNSNSNEFNTIKDAFDPELPKEYSLDQLKLANMSTNTNRLSKELEKEVKAGNMTQEEANAYEHKFNETVSALKKTHGVKMTDDKRVEAVNKVALKEELEREVKGMDSGLAAKKKEQIKALEADLIEMSTGKRPETDGKARPEKETKKDEGETVDTKGEADTKAEQTTEEVTRTKGVEVNGAPEGTYINVGMIVGKTKKEITMEEIQDSLPEGVEVFESQVTEGTEPTATIELSRPLTDGEMNQFLKDTKQLAIPQLSGGKGVMYGTLDWGEFNPDYFVMFGNSSLSDTISRGNEIKNIIKEGEQIKEESGAELPEGEGAEGTGQEGVDRGDTGDVQTGKNIKEKTQEIADKIRTAKINSSVKDAMSKLRSAPTGVFELAWDGAVETVARTVEATGDVALALEKGMEQLRSSKWYQDLSDTGKRMAERKFMDFFRDEVKLAEVKRDETNAFMRKVQQIEQKFVDGFSNVNTAIKGLQGAKEFYKKQGLFESKAADQIANMLDSAMKGIKKIAKSPFKMKEVSDYMYAKHALDRNQYIRENVDEENPFGSGMTDSEANAILEKYDATQTAQIEALAKPFYDLIDGSRETLVKTGLMSQEAMDNLRSSSDTYVPLTGFADEQVELGSNIVQGKKVSVKGAEFKGLTGRTTEANNVISNIVKQYTDIALRGSKNELLQEFDNIAKSNEDFPYKIYTTETLPRKKGRNKDTKKVTYAKAPAQIDDTFVGFKVNGVQKYIKFNNPVLAQNLNRSTDAVVDGFTRTAGRLNRFLSGMFTQYNPTFMIPNFFRDLQVALINLKAQADINPDLNGQDLSAKAGKNVLTAIKTIHADERGANPTGKYADYYKEFKAQGAKTGWANRMSLKEINMKAQAMEKLFSTTHYFDKTTVKRGWNAFVDIVDNANTAIENGIRLSSYVAAREAGLSSLDAASLAKELTINFNRRGEIGGLMNTLYLFFNASVQGVSTFAKNMAVMKTYTDSKGRKRKTLNRGQKAALAVMMSSIALAMYNMSMSGEDEESGLDVYSSIPDYEKERNLIIMHPNGRTYTKIPLPYGYNLFSNVGTMAAETAFGERKVADAVDFTMGSITGSFLPFNTPEGDVVRKAKYAAIPTVLTPSFMLAENKDYFGSQIFRENFPTSKDKLATSHLGSKNTPEWYKKSAILLNNAAGGNQFEESPLNFHPDKMEFLVDYFGGGALKFLKDTYGVAEKGYIKATGTDIDIDPRKVPLLNKVYGEDTHFPEMNIYYTVQENYRRRLNALKEDPKSDREEKVNLMKLDALYKVTDKKLKLIREKEKAVLLRPTTRGRLEGLEEIDLKKKKVYSQHVKKYLEIKKKLKGDYE